VGEIDGSACTESNPLKIPILDSVDKLRARKKTVENPCRQDHRLHPLDPSPRSKAGRNRRHRFAGCFRPTVSSMMAVTHLRQRGMSLLTSSALFP
jgi:hypothetical protein